MSKESSKFKVEIVNPEALYLHECFGISTTRVDELASVGEKIMHRMVGSAPGNDKTPYTTSNGIKEMSDACETPNELAYGIFALTSSIQMYKKQQEAMMRTNLKELLEVLAGDNKGPQNSPSSGIIE